jgi:oxygen-independent coproporphyrinogen III oxidase
VRGLYVHVPFCVKKCSYCDFYSIPLQNSLIDLYIQALKTECLSYQGLSFDTLYLGGGTPSLLGPDNLIKLVDSLRHAFNLSNLIEATIEVNPESATVSLLVAAKSAGINRISIGVQSLCQQELERVGRIHTVTQAFDVVGRSKKIGFDTISADLIVGLPGQNWETLHASLEALISLGINHLSLYCLSLEHDTPLALNPPIDLPSDDVQADLFESASLFLGNHEFSHYEISNFAITGHECLHNMIYWRGGEYLGLGPAAASHMGGKRFRNRADLHAYMKTPTNVVEDVEELRGKDKAAEETMLRLRLLEEGINPNDLYERYGHENITDLVCRLYEMATTGDLLFDGIRFRLPKSRILTSNQIFARVLFG